MIGSYTKKLSGVGDEDMAFWLHQLDRGIKRRKDEEDRWTHNESYENMEQWVDENGEQYGGEYDEVTVNKVGSWMQTERASLAFTNPRVKLTPISAGGYKPIQVPVMGEDGTPQLDPMTGQVVVQEVLPYKIKESFVNTIIAKPSFGLRDTMTRLIKAGQLAYGAIGTGYRPEFETGPERETDQVVPMKNGQLDFSAYIMNPITGAPMEDENGDLIRKSSLPVSEEWFMDWTNYRHLIIDPDGENDFNRHGWVALEQVRLLEDVKADVLFENTDDLEATGDVHDWEQGLERESFTENEELSERLEQIRLFHIWDMAHDEYLVIADGHDEFLRREPMPLGIIKNPFSMYRPNEILGEFYPRPKASDLAPINDHYNMARTQELRAMKKSNRKIVVKPGFLDQLNMQKLTSNEDMAIVTPKDDGPYDLGTSILPIGTPPINDALYANVSMISKDFDEIAGQPGESRGVASSKTATQVNALSQYATVRMDFSRKTLVDTLVIAFEKLIESIEANMTTEKAVELVGADGQTFMAIVEREMMMCDCSVEVDVQELQPKDDSAQSSRLIQAMQVVANAPWMVADEATATTFFDIMGIKDQNFINAMVNRAQMQLQMEMMAMMPPPQGQSPEGAPPENAGQAAMQDGAGSQVPRMSSAT